MTARAKDEIDQNSAEYCAGYEGAQDSHGGVVASNPRERILLGTVLDGLASYGLWQLSNVASNHNHLILADIFSTLSLWALIAWAGIVAHDVLPWTKTIFFACLVLATGVGLFIFLVAGGSMLGLARTRFALPVILTALTAIAWGWALWHKSDAVSGGIPSPSSPAASRSSTMPTSKPTSEPSPTTQRIQKRLGDLGASDAESLMNFSLRGYDQKPDDSVCKRLSHPPELIERDFTHGWRIVPDIKDFVYEWAEKRSSDAASLTESEANLLRFLAKRNPLRTTPQESREYIPLEAKGLAHVEIEPVRMWNHSGSLVRNDEAIVRLSDAGMKALDSLGIARPHVEVVEAQPSPRLAELNGQLEKTRAVREVFDKWATMFTNWEFVLRTVTDRKNIEPAFPLESQRQMTDLLQSFRKEAKEIIGVAESYGVDAGPLRSICMSPIIGVPAEKRAEIRAVLDKLEGALLREQRNSPSALPPPAPPAISRRNPGRSFRVLHDAVGNWRRGDVFTEYDFRMAMQSEIPSHIDPDDHFEEQINRLLKLQAICVIG